MQTVEEIKQASKRELELGIDPLSGASWHNAYRDSAYVFVGNWPNHMNEGDLITVFSQWGEIADVNLVRDKDSGAVKGFGFIAYEDQRSTILAVDNFNGATVGGRTLRVDHVAEYLAPAHKDEEGGLKPIEERVAGITRPWEAAQADAEKERRRAERAELRAEKEERKKDREDRRRAKRSKSSHHRSHRSESSKSAEQ